VSPFQKLDEMTINGGVSFSQGSRERLDTRKGFPHQLLSNSGVNIVQRRDSFPELVGQVFPTEFYFMFQILTGCSSQAPGRHSCKSAW
jgi:hypothetical protein